MADWIDELAQALDVPALSPEEQRELLAAARDVAHRTERRITPLSTFLLGCWVGGRDAPRDRATADAIARLRAVLPAAEPGAEDPSPAS